MKTRISRCAARSEAVSGDDILRGLGQGSLVRIENASPNGACKACPAKSGTQNEVRKACTAKSGERNEVRKDCAVKSGAWNKVCEACAVKSGARNGVREACAVKSGARNVGREACEVKSGARNGVLEACTIKSGARNGAHHDIWTPIFDCHTPGATMAERRRRNGGRGDAIVTGGWGGFGKGEPWGQGGEAGGEASGEAGDFSTRTRPGNHEQ